MPDAINQVRKYLDWKSWFEGMYVNAIKSATGAFLAFAGTNSVEAVAPAVFSGVGLNWKQAAGAFLSVLILEIVRYVNAKPLPEARVEEDVK